MSLITALLLAAAAPAAAQVAVSTAPAPAAQTVEQAYRPATQRDPLVPATVYGDMKGGEKAKLQGSQGPAAPAVESATFTVYGLTLTGIMEDSRGREALLRDAAGNRYTLRAGRLTDPKKKTVPGVSGVVKGKQVILMTDDKKVHHLNLREND